MSASPVTLASHEDFRIVAPLWVVSGPSFFPTCLSRAAFAALPV